MLQEVTTQVGDLSGHSNSSIPCISANYDTGCFYSGAFPHLCCNRNGVQTGNGGATWVPVPLSFLFGMPTPQWQWGCGHERRRGCVAQEGSSLEWPQQDAWVRRSAIEIDMPRFPYHSSACCYSIKKSWNGAQDRSNLTVWSWMRRSRGIYLFSDAS